MSELVHSFDLIKKFSSYALFVFDPNNALLWLVYNEIYLDSIN